MQEVTRYGIHWLPGKIAFLHQARGGVNAIGLKEPSPLLVRTRRRWVCNHLVSLNATNPARTHLDRFADLVGRNSLVRFMLPLPRDEDHGVAVLHTQDKDMAHVGMLLKMSSPTRLPIIQASMTKPQAVLEELEMTDVQPLVLAGVEARHTDWVANLILAAAVLPRRLLIMSARDVPLRVKTLNCEHMARQDALDLVSLPWETMGAIVVRAYMRGEWTGSGFTREPVPANEPKIRRNDEQ